MGNNTTVGLSAVAGSIATLLWAILRRVTEIDPTPEEVAATVVLFMLLLQFFTPAKWRRRIKRTRATDV